jgi:hypothetical protein
MLFAYAAAAAAAAAAAHMQHGFVRTQKLILS